MPATQNRHGLSVVAFRAMQEMLRGLSASERRSLSDPDFITEDEADLIVVRRRRNEKSFPAELLGHR